MRDTARFRKDIASLSLVLGLASAACILMFFVRFAVTGRALYGFLVWNLFLAGVPYLIALGVLTAERRMTGPRPRAIIVMALSVLWLIFYPNAPYLFTDFIYIFRRTFLWRAPIVPIVPVGLEALVWFDIVMSSAFAFIGHFIGLVSIYLIQASLRAVAGRSVAWASVVLAMLLSGFGIYLGRFSRLNSWDLLVRPYHAFPEIFSSLGDAKALLFSAAFSLFVGVTYLMLYAFKRVEP
ncbi:MAG: DUF1361 domain-containing protein [Spirochaetes bacterium]|nr:DUF1361 domain-containing protein [Spirochaetota bacterium]